MNLYAVSPDPEYCAKYLDTKRLGWGAVKESAQLIATALHELYGVETEIKPTHPNHPISIWVRERFCNLQWTLKYMDACHKEYVRRRQKEYNIHGKSASYWHEALSQLFHKHLHFTQIMELGMLDDRLDELEFCNCACRKDLGIDYRHIENVHDAYRMYLAHRWMTDKRMPVWG